MASMIWYKVTCVTKAGKFVKFEVFFFLFKRIHLDSEENVHITCFNVWIPESMNKLSGSLMNIGMFLAMFLPLYSIVSLFF